jgi:hypothetical protein
MPGQPWRSIGFFRSIPVALVKYFRCVKSLQSWATPSTIAGHEQVGSSGVDFEAVVMAGAPGLFSCDLRQPEDGLADERSVGAADTKATSETPKTFRVIFVGHCTATLQRTVRTDRRHGDREIGLSDWRDDLDRYEATFKRAATGDQPE